MGVLAGRIPGKVEEGRLVRARNKLLGASRGFLAFAENYGLTLAGQEVESLKYGTGSKIAGAIETYGVRTCDRGAEFWKGKK